MLQTHTLRPQRCSFIEVDGYAQFVPYTLSCLVRNFGAVLQCDVFEWHEWNDVGCPHPRVHAGVASQIDPLGCNPDRMKRSFAHCFGGPGERQYGAIVIRVGSCIQQRRARHRCDGSRERSHNQGIAAFGEIRHTLDEHSLLSNARIAGARPDAAGQRARQISHQGGRHFVFPIWNQDRVATLQTQQRGLDNVLRLQPEKARNTLTTGAQGGVKFRFRKARTRATAP